MMLLDGKSDLEMFKHRKQTWLREVPVYCQIGFGLSIELINKVYEIFIKNSKRLDQVVMYTFIFIIHQVDRYST